MKGNGAIVLFVDLAELRATLSGTLRIRSGIRVAPTVSASPKPSVTAAERRLTKNIVASAFESLTFDNGIVFQPEAFLRVRSRNSAEQEVRTLGEHRYSAKL